MSFAAHSKRWLQSSSRRTFVLTAQLCMNPSSAPWCLQTCQLPLTSASRLKCSSSMIRMHFVHEHPRRCLLLRTRRRCSPCFLLKDDSAGCEHAKACWQVALLRLACLWRWSRRCGCDPGLTLRLNKKCFCPELAFRKS